jgi:N-acetylglucosaminyldiphosphoundecaprenol N-acetyl-beta-D-mannosaminyltransferase
MNRSHFELSTLGDLCGMRYSRETIDQLHRSLCGWLNSSDRSRNVAIGYLNPHVFNLAHKHEELKAFLREAEVVAVDGLGVALAIGLLRGCRQTRTVMTPLFDKMVLSEEIPPSKAILIGGNPEVAAKGAAAITAASPRITVVEALDGYRSIPEYVNFVGQHTEAELVLVGMGSPRSEELIQAARKEHAGRIFWNIGGGTLHFYAGTQPRVPAILSKIGLQWLWRIIHEPTITPRYVIGIPEFGTRLLKHLILNRPEEQDHA